MIENHGGQSVALDGGDVAVGGHGGGADSCARAPSPAGRSGEELVLPADSEVEPTLSFVLPTLNEAEGVAECIASIERCLEELGVFGEVIVSDSSTDDTPEIARRNGAIVVHPEETGYGAAYRYAFERARGDYVAIGDADTTYDFEEVPKLFERVAEGDADMALGSRLDGEIEPGAMPPLHQYVGNPLLTAFLNAFYGTGVSDAHSGLRVVDADALSRLHLESSGMEFASEMIMEAGAHDLTIAEEPITYHRRSGEATLESFRDGWRHVRFMLVNAPGYLFSVPGAALAGLGVVLMLLAFGKVTVGSVGFRVHSMIAGSLLTIVGFQVLSLGVFAVTAGDPIRVPDDPFTELLTDRVGLEEAATLGLLVFGGGTAYAVLMLGRWVASGFTRLPLVHADVFAFTAIVVGLQLVFNAFCLSAIESPSRR